MSTVNTTIDYEHTPSFDYDTASLDSFTFLAETESVMVCLLTKKASQTFFLFSSD